MPTIIQVAYVVPDDVHAKLLTGELTRLRSIAVRDHLGITEHLKEVALPINTENALLRVAEGVRTYRVPILIGLGVVVVTSGIAVWAADRKNQRATSEVPDWVLEYNAALGSYLEAVRNGALDEPTLNRLISAVDAVKEKSDTGKISFEISTEQVGTLVALIADYTSRLADANSIHLGELAGPATDSADSPIVELRNHLRRQKQIFDSAA